MNYYQHHIGDYAAATAHLTPLEDCFYRRMLDRYYQTEKPLPGDHAKLFRVLRAVTKADKKSVLNVVDEFFVLESDGYRQRRCEEELFNYSAKGEASRNNGAKGGRPPKNPLETTEPITQPVKTGLSNENPDVTQKKANQEPRTKNQDKPPTPNGVPPPSTRTGSRLPEDWVLPDTWAAEAKRLLAELNRPDLEIKTEADKFRDHWCAQPGAKGRKSDWLGTWRNWIRKAVEYQRGPPSSKTSATHIGKQDYSAGWNG